MPYLRRYAAHFKLPVVTGVRLSNVERPGQIFRLTTGRGRYQAQTVVAATGFFGRPHLPHLPGQAEFRDQPLHAADYRRPEPFRGQRLVVVGGEAMTRSAMVGAGFVGFGSVAPLYSRSLNEGLKGPNQR